MQRYSTTQVNQVKTLVRTGKDLNIIASDLAKEWKRPYHAVYSKVWRISKITRKITKNFSRPKVINTIPLPDSLMAEIGVKDVTKDINTPIDTVQPADIGIEVPVNSMNFIGVPSKIVVYSNHVRYYFDN